MVSLGCRMHSCITVVFKSTTSPRPFQVDFYTCSTSPVPVGDVESWGCQKAESCIASRII